MKLCVFTFLVFFLQRMQALLFLQIGSRRGLERSGFFGGSSTGPRDT